MVKFNVQVSQSYASKAAGKPEKLCKKHSHTHTTLQDGRPGVVSCPRACTSRLASVTPSSRRASDRQRATETGS
ncbi:hypothetical protein RRG08_028191 [Elysia crispata]|uniref:Uncharacterized protein n=1 Tax=Elysia crispata TaxID=231223 RepID=A0AAE1EBA6_9GAST|nr:hypothetical protein RRG08_028191 [Elysia crispata]